MESSFLGKDQSRTEIGTDREQEWMLQEEVSDLQLSPLLVAPQNTHGSRSDGSLFVRQGHSFIVPLLLLANAVRSIRYTGVKAECFITGCAVLE